MHTTTKGDLGVGLVLADLLRRGLQIALPLGENQRYDLIVDLGSCLHRVQCKAVTPKSGALTVKTRSTSSWSGKTQGSYKYTAADIEVLAVVDLASEGVYYLPASLLGNGKSELKLRLEPTKNGQIKGIRMASAYADYPSSTKRKDSGSTPDEGA